VLLFKAGARWVSRGYDRFTFHLRQSRIAMAAVARFGTKKAVLPEMDRIRSALMAPRKKRVFSNAHPNPPPGYLPLGGSWGAASRCSWILFASRNIARCGLRGACFSCVHAGIHTRCTRPGKTGVDDCIAPVAAEVAANVKLPGVGRDQIRTLPMAMIVGTPGSKPFRRCRGCGDDLEADNGMICTKTG